MGAQYDSLDYAMEQKTLVLASSNQGKLKEFSELLRPLEIAITPQSKFGVQACEEPYHTFIENALAKARHASRCTNFPALADDSGICVEALNGAPGVHSARYACTDQHTQCSDARNNEFLVKQLAHLNQPESRRAHYICVLVLVRHALDPQPLIAQGIWHGEILKQPRGQAGFGYDPLFWVTELNQSAAELDSHTKNSISHRAQAMTLLIELLQNQKSHIWL